MRRRILRDATDVSRLGGALLGGKCDSRASIHEEHFDSNGVRALVFRPQGHRGSIIVAPGLHYDGPSDPRFTSFCRALALGGNLVFAPFIEDFSHLRVTQAAISNFAQALNCLRKLDPVHRPGVVSISFGSLLAAHLLANHPTEVGAGVLFGGYSSFEKTLEHCVWPQSHRPSDPLNRPAVFVNVLEYFALCPGNETDRARLRHGWVDYAKKTWGRTLPPDENERRAICEAIADGLAEDLRTLFVAGCVGQDGPSMLRDALLRASEQLQVADPSEALGRITQPVTVVHGYGDEVIPWEQGVALARSMPNASNVDLLLSNVSSHTRVARLPVATWMREMAPTYKILRALVNVGRS